MKKYDSIINDIFNSCDYRGKGSSVNVAESFLLERNGLIFLVVIMEITDFANTQQKYEYAMYSITSNRYIEKTEELFKSIVTCFPQIDEISKAGGSISFAEKKRLTNMFYDIVEKVGSDNSMTGDLLKVYQDYLAAMEKVKSPSLQKVYCYFKEEVENGAFW